MAKWVELTEEQKQIARNIVIDLGIPLKEVPNFEFNLEE